MADKIAKYLLEWNTPDGDYIYGYKTYEELMEVIKTFKGKDYIHYKAYIVESAQILMFNN